jgi:predicted permease
MGAAAGFLLAGAALILLIACLNVAGLFLARAFARRREIAVRLSLGAARGRIVRLLLVEASAPALAGGALGVGLTAVTARALGAVPLPLDVPLSFDVAIDGGVLGFAFATAVATCLAFGLLPALRASRPDLVGALRGNDSGSRGRRPRTRQALVALQVAGSIALLVGAALCLRSTGALASADPGLDPAGVAVASWQPREGTDDEEAVRLVVRDLTDRLLASPEIDEVAAAAVAELSPWARRATAELRVDGRDEPERTVVAGNVVSPGYFEMLDLEPLRGRTFGAADDAAAPPVAIVNETFARTFWPGEVALGRRFTILGRRFAGRPYDYRPRAVEVIGVLPDVRALPGRDEAFFWTSLLQDHSPAAVFHVRSPDGPAAAVPELRRIVQRTGGVYLVPAQSYARLAEVNTLGPRLALQAFTWSGGFALLLAVMGIYGVVSFSVGQRTREMAVRQAIGAGARRVLRSVVLDAMKLALLGAVVGLAVALPLAALARSSLYGISPLDPPALVGAVAVLLASALAATVMPARRAAHVDPMRILREE